MNWNMVPAQMQGFSFPFTLQHRCLCDNMVTTTPQDLAKRNFLSFFLPFFLAFFLAIAICLSTSSRRVAKMITLANTQLNSHFLWFYNIDPNSHYFC
jgi:hypothetical protein